MKTLLIILFVLIPLLSLSQENIVDNTQEKLDNIVLETTDYLKDCRTSTFEDNTFYDDYYYKEPQREYYDRMNKEADNNNSDTQLYYSKGNYKPASATTTTIKIYSSPTTDTRQPVVIPWN